MGRPYDFLTDATAMNHPTTSQTIGPFPHEGWRWAFDTRSGAAALTISGRVLDGDGEPVTDAMLEAWVPQGDGAVGGLPGLYRIPTDEQGAFVFALPGKPAAGEPAAFITVFARGLLKHQFSAVFLADDVALADSPVLGQVPADRRATLIAPRTGDASYRWDVHLQGPRETVFFDYE